MKTILTLITAILLSNFSFAQLSDGSIAPDFTFTDINGTTQHLYAYLDSGKYVALDISATWCHPCWLYHETHTIDSLYNLHDIPGDKKWKVIFIEGDGGTNSADLHGTGGSTQGDWVTGVPFPIIDPPTGMALSDFNVGYNIGFFPTLMLICPNRRIYQDTLNAGSKPTVARWENVAAMSSCTVSALNSITQKRVLNILPNPANNSITLNFKLSNCSKLSLTVSNMIGQIINTQSLETLQDGSGSTQLDLSQYNSGLYIFAVSDDLGNILREKVVIQK